MGKKSKTYDVEPKVTEVIKKATSGEIGRVPGLGTFRLSKRKYRNPKNGKPGVANVVIFHASKGFKWAANRPVAKVYKTKKRK